MSNQTFVKKDRISFAQNSNEQIAIAPSNITTNALYIGPNSAITYDTLSNVQNINTLAGVTLSNQYIYADGTYLSNLPTTSGVTQSNLNSTITGLGSIEYISSSQLISTVNGLGNIYLSSGATSQSVLTSTIIGLGTFGYLSTNTVPSTIVGLGTFGYISSLQLQSTVRGLGNIYLSTNIIPSTIVGLGTFGYISSASLYSSIQSYGFVSSSTLQSSLIGLGTFGYISTASLYSSIQSYGFVSSSTLQSSLIGLGTFGYISSSQLESTVRGLGSIGYISSASLISTMSNWSLFPAISNVNMSYSSILNVNTINTSSIYVSSISTTIINLTGTATGGVYPEITFTDLFYNTTDNLIYFDNNLVFSGNILVSNLNATNISANSLNIDTIQVNDGDNVIFLSPIDMNNNPICNVCDIIPYADLTCSLGSPELRFSNAYIGGASLHIGDTAVLGESNNGYLSTNTILYAKGTITSSITLLDSNLSDSYGNLKYQSSLLYFQNQIIGGTLQWTPQRIKFLPDNFPAPTIDWDNSSNNGGNITIAWFPVTGATSYKIFDRSSKKPYVNKYTINDTIVLNRSLTAQFFDYDSGPIMGTSFSFGIGSFKNIFIFAYNNTTRSDFPTRQIYIDGDGIQLWPVFIEEFYGGSNFDTCTSMKITNSDSGQNIIGSRDDVINNNPPFDANYPQNCGGVIATK